MDKDQARIGSLKYKIILRPFAIKCLKKIRDRSILRHISQSIGNLAFDPEAQGKALIGGLKGYRSLRSSAQRYRIIFRVERVQIIGYVVAVNIQKAGDKNDIYNLAKKLLRQHLL